MDGIKRGTGLCHVYWGDGKGKTTAAMGLALRALGSGLRVTVVQFLKDGQSGELAPLRRLGAKVYSGAPGMKFAYQMTPKERAAACAEHTSLLEAALKEPCDMLVLDEACAACQLGMVEEALLKKAVCGRPQGTEVVLTGRQPAQWMLETADYSTEMCCRRHPYEQGVAARKGVEF
ncbi:MAG: cob(I)yrinic acid a,c-diamide adenosyltransferase [Ruthenibacterium sp.]